MRPLAQAVCALLVAGGGVARADILDFSLQKLVKPPMNGGFADPNDMESQKAYRQLISELGVAMAPQFLTTADTVGYNGFNLQFDTSWTSITNHVCTPGQTKDLCPWSGGAGNPGGVSGKDLNGNPQSIPGYVTTISLLARKGIWLPLPSFEIGAGATKLLQSDVWAVQVYAKFALHEGFHDWPIPSLAVRGAAVRILGASQIDLTMAQLDAEISKSFGLFGTLTLVPYVGAAYLRIIARGQVLDTTPSVDAYKQGPNSLDLNNNAVFPDQNDIERYRFFGGFRLVYAVLVLHFDYSISTPGDWLLNKGDKTIPIPDSANMQQTFSVSAGFLF